jgi:hypothetical protein
MELGMDIKEFSLLHNLKPARDECGEIIISGSKGQIYDWGSGIFGVLVDAGTVRAWTFLRKRLEKKGFCTVQNGDTEGCLLFDPASKAQTKLAIKAIKVRLRKKPSFKAIKSPGNAKTSLYLYENKGD